MRYPLIRQDADTAVAIAEAFQGQMEPEVMNVVALLFNIDASTSAQPPSLEFLQGFFSGLAFAEGMLSERFDPEAPETRFVAALAMVAAEKYLAGIQASLGG